MPIVTIRTLWYTAAQLRDHYGRGDQEGSEWEFEDSFVVSVESARNRDGVAVYKLVMIRHYE